MENKTLKKVPVNYKKIYSDILTKKFPEKSSILDSIKNKDSLSYMEIINLNQKIFGNADNETERFNQTHRSYDESTILKILEYQKDNCLSNLQVSLHFKISRNTIAKWKKIFAAKKPDRKKIR
ncbi:helix-turn-helix domain-containing protein [Chryseobacterium sp. LAM-KRS1]|uniref:helix-turn-helix domain-containing protein n=1 Tax=Chryseobacterium sp. LAM-KRS1 TaxID=2715754 RepID=UPI001556F648|nr:helix-turn-helix domain-containing protein [Chryseobacterium sp. LAM-KRS1]